MNLRPWMWWLVFALLLAFGEGLGWLLYAQGMPLGAQVPMWAGRILAAGWVIYGLVRWRETPLIRKTALSIVVTLAAALIAGLALSLGWAGGAITVAGAWAMLAAYVGGVALIRLLFSPGLPAFGVARTVVDEAIRMKIGWVFVVAIMLIVPALPFALDPQEQLRYRIQSFLTWSLTATSVILGLMTVILAVRTITSEFDKRQVFLTLTKPVSRGQYLLGKWLGVMALNLVLVAVAGGAIYLFTMLLARQPARGPMDALAVHEQVLVARTAVSPIPADPNMLPRAFRERIERLRQSEPNTYGVPGSPIEALPDELRQSVQQQLMTEWHALPPRGNMTYRFTGLARAKELGPTVQLRISPRAGGTALNGFVYLGMQFNGYHDQTNPVRKLAEGQTHVLDIPSQLISDQGVLDVTIHNVAVDGRDQPSISFNPGDGLQLLYKVGGFTPNFIRSLAIVWVRLGFLAMLGLAAGTYLGFPVACLLAMLVYFTAIGSGYLAESLQSYAGFPKADTPLWDRIVWVPSQILAKLGAGEVWDAIKIVVRLIGSGFMLLVPSFGDYNPTPLLSDGQVVSTRMLGGAALWVGVVWTGTIAFIGWLIFRYRELARVTV